MSDHIGHLAEHRGRTYHTYNPMPASWCCRQHLLDLPPEVDVSGVAVHEAGHLVAGLVAGIRIVEVTLMPGTGQCWKSGPVFDVGGSTETGYNAVSDRDYVTMLAAGEMAHHRWLAESGLTTPERAWAVEYGAWDDVEKAIHRLRNVWPPDWREDWLRMKFWNYRPEAETLLDEHWDRVRKVAEALASRRRLSGNEAADLAGLANPDEPLPQDSQTPPPGLRE